nr:hypothetical protein [Tanacetum cinerariifolium]
ATFPTLANTLKSPTYLGFSLPRLPNRTTPFQAPVVVSIIPSSKMELSGMALEPRVQLLELDRYEILPVELVVDLENSQETLQESIGR